jgi:hypothetical protein
MPTLAPVLSAAATRLYEQLEPLAPRDSENGYAAAYLCAAVAAPLDPLYGLFEDIEIPWAKLMDADMCPEWALDWLAQLAGASVEGITDVAIKRERIKGTDGQKRGTRAAIENAMKVHLTGPKNVTIVERDTSPYHFLAITYTSQTPDSAKVLAAIREQKPAGLQFTYRVDTGWSIGEMEAAYTAQTIADMHADFTTIGNLESNIPI